MRIKKKKQDLRLVHHIDKRPTGHKAHQSSGLESLLHFLSNLYRLIENIPLQTPTVCGVDKIYNDFPHFDCHGNK